MICDLAFTLYSTKHDRDIGIFSCKLALFILLLFLFLSF